MLLVVMVVGSAHADDCKRPQPSLCEQLKVQSAVSTDTRAALGIEQARAEFAREKTVTLASLSQRVVDDSQRLVVGCLLASAKQLSCSDWQRLYKQEYSPTGAAGTWTMAFTMRAASAIAPGATCDAADPTLPLAETWEIAQDGRLVAVRSRTDRNAGALPFKWYSGSLDGSGVALSAKDDRRGRGECSLRLDGNKLTGSCSLTWDMSCRYDFAVAGHLSAW